MNVIQILKSMIVILLVALLMVNIQAAPAPGTEWDPRNNPCYDDVKEELCQRCAKQTKSIIVYPLCCNQQEGAYEWCDKFVHFGLYH